MGPQEEDNKRLAQEMLDALTRNDVEWVREHYAEDVRLWVTGSSTKHGWLKVEAAGGFCSKLTQFSTRASTATSRPSACTFAQKDEHVRSFCQHAMGGCMLR